jgi:tetraacyldisaccharide 4'-kinase
MLASPLQYIIKATLTLLGKVYALTVGIYLNLLERKSVKLPVPVISVGNISMGGTGKTPVCQFLADYFTQKNKRPVILTRGYKSRPGNLPHLVSIDDDPKLCGDEPLLLARSLNGKADIVVDPNRSRSAVWAMNNLNPDVFILDDGFQHVRLKRDQNLVLLTPHDLESGWDKVFPRGAWREGKQGLERADLFLINLWGRNIKEIKHQAVQKAALRQRPVFWMDVRIEKLKNIGSENAVRDISKRPYILVSGVANPQKIVLSIRDFLGYGPISHLPFPDHHEYGQESVKAIIALAEEADVKDIICTSKDAVKLNPIPGLRVWETKITVRIMDGMEQEFLDRINIYPNS